jgi:hypothetical protein
MALLDPPECF